MKINRIVRHTYVIVLMLASGCGKDPAATGDLSPKKGFEDFVASLASFKADISREEAPASEDLFAGVGELSAKLNDVLALTAGRPELEPTFKSMQDTLEEMIKVLQNTQQAAQLRPSLDKLEEQSASLRQQL
jgi:hypothetical protein